MHTSLMIFLAVFGPAEPRPRSPSYRMSDDVEPFPWLGVLRAKRGASEALARLVLIGAAAALANAHDVAPLDAPALRRSARAAFFGADAPWQCGVGGVALHPEYGRTYSTPAIVELNATRATWRPVGLPRRVAAAAPAYAAGLSDRGGEGLRRALFRMRPVGARACRRFYHEEQLDAESFRPKHLLCYRAAAARRRCAFDSAMALVARREGEWTLLGVGVAGPGCALPSRYVRLLPYAGWLRGHLHREPPRGGFRRHDAPTIGAPKTAIDPAADIASDSHDVEDDFYVDKLDESTMALRPGHAHVREEVHGDCVRTAGVVMYREAGAVRAPGRPATAVYALSIYDLHYYKITCVMVSVRCTRRSITKFWYERGFRKDDFAPFIKTVPFPKERHETPPKILFLTDDYHNYRNVFTANLLFKFEFDSEGTINIDFYGIRATSTTTSTTSTTPAPARTRRPYHHNTYATSRIIIDSD